MDTPAIEREQVRKPLQLEKLPLGIRIIACSNVTISTSRARIGYQVFIFVLTYWMYAIYTLARRPFSVVKIVLCPPCAEADFSNSSNTSDLLGWAPFNSTNGKTLLGSVDLSLLFAYATGLYISGFVADRSNLRYFLTFGMTGSGLAALFLGLGYFFQVHHLAYFIVFSICAGFMQSTGWPGLLGITGRWFGKKSRGVILGVWASCAFVGSILGYIVPSFFVYSDSVEDSPWGWSFITPAIITIATAGLAFLFLVTDPMHLGFEAAIQDVEKKKSVNTATAMTANGHATANGDVMSNENKLEVAKCKEEEAEEEKNEDNLNAADDKGKAPIELKTKSKPINWCRALLIPGVIEYALALFCNKMVTYSFAFWLPFYTAVNYPAIGGRQAAWYSTFFDVGGIVGGVIIGIISDRLLSRAIMIVPMLITGVPVLFLMREFGDESLVVYIVFVFLIGLFINGPHIIIAGAVANDLGTHKSLKDDQNAKSTVSGIIDGTGSMGAALGPLIVGAVADIGDNGWNNVFYIMMTATFMSAMLLLRLLFKETKKIILRCRSSCEKRLQSSAKHEDKYAMSADLNRMAARNRTFDLSDTAAMEPSTTEISEM